MIRWPGDPIATMTVENLSLGTSTSINFLGPTEHTTTDIALELRIKVRFVDDPAIDNGRGYFEAYLHRLADSGELEYVDSQSKRLGNDNDNDTWTDYLVLNATMQREVEKYRLRLLCKTQDTSLGTDSGYIYRWLTAIQGQLYAGDFTIDFLPVAIVYCPPNQDMTASLQQSTSYGTRFTIGTTEQFQSEIGVSGDVQFLGMRLMGVAATDSQSISNRTDAGIEVNYFRNTLLMADNQKAIGRAFWGPLGDLFAIAVNPRFAMSRRADGTIFYNAKDVDQVVLVPAHKLLRPDADPISGMIPSDVRRRILELDPFLRNLDRFFPDSGAPLTDAANPEADPSADNRAELLGRWWIGAGAELTYAVGESKKLFSGEATEVEYQATVTVEAGAGVNLFDMIGVGVQQGSTFTTSVRFQSSKETFGEISTTAACSLIRNQNAQDLSGIEIYYDKLFSSLMFRRVPVSKGPPLVGIVSDPFGNVISRIPVEAICDKLGRSRTVTGFDGRFCLFLDPSTACEIHVGDQIVRLAAGKHPHRLRVEKVRRTIDLNKAPRWELAAWLGVSSERLRHLSRHLHRVFDLEDLVHLLALPRAQLRALARTVKLRWPATPLSLLPINHEELAQLHALGVTSLQRLVATRNLTELERAAGIPEQTLGRWVEAAQRLKAAQAGSPPFAESIGDVTGTAPLVRAFRASRKALLLGPTHGGPSQDDSRDEEEG